MPSYVFSLAPHLEKQAKWLLQSIQSNTSVESEEIFIFLAESEKDDINSLPYFRKRGTIIGDKIPNEDYPLSALHRALEMACARSTNEYVVCLDTDTVVLQDIHLPTTDAELMAVYDYDIGSFWSREESRTYWEKLHNRYNINFEEPIRWFNGGVLVVDTDSNFPQDWKRISDDLYEDISVEKYFSEMVALGLLSNKYKFEELNENKNYMQGIHLDPPSKNTEIIHYIDEITIYRSMFNPIVRKKLRDTDIIADINKILTHKKYYRLVTSYMKALRSSHPNTIFASAINRLDPSR